MKCLHPVTITYSPKDRYAKKSIQVPCGNCPACFKRKQNEWAYRCFVEDKYNSGISYFITLTYSDDFIPIASNGYPTLLKSDVSDFMKRLRNNLSRGYGISSPRFFACGEYGEKFDRPHYHLLLFNLPDTLTRDELQCIIEKSWSKSINKKTSSYLSYGFVTVSSLNIARCKYVAKYCTKLSAKDCPEGIQKPFALMSRRPAIGKSFLSTPYAKDIKNRKLFLVNDDQGTTYSLPRYLRDKIHSKYVIDKHSELVSSCEYSTHLFYINKGALPYKLFISENLNNNRVYEELFYKRLKEKSYKK